MTPAIYFERKPGILITVMAISDVLVTSGIMLIRNGPSIRDKQKVFKANFELKHYISFRYQFKKSPPPHTHTRIYTYIVICTLTRTELHSAVVAFSSNLFDSLAEWRQEGSLPLSVPLSYQQ